MENKLTREQAEMMKKLLNPANAELSDDELENVVGGADVSLEELGNIVMDLGVLADKAGTGSTGGVMLNAALGAFMKGDVKGGLRAIAMVSIYSPDLFDQCMDVIMPYLNIVG